MLHALILSLEISELPTETILNHAFHLPPSDKTHDPFKLLQDGERDNFGGVVNISVFFVKLNQARWKRGMNGRRREGERKSRHDLTRRVLGPQCRQVDDRSTCPAAATRVFPESRRPPSEGPPWTITSSDRQTQALLPERLFYSQKDKDPRT